MTDNTQQKSSISQHPLLKQLHSGHFDCAPILLLNLFELEEGLLLFYFCEEPTFSLGAALVSKTNGKRNLIWKSDGPIWQSDEKIKPINLTKKDNAFTFHFKTGKQKGMTTFSLDEILKK